MKLKKLEITNFRCFESLSIDLDEQLTVLVAKNGQGKSSVLDAIRIGLWPFVSGFDLAQIQVMRRVTISTLMMYGCERISMIDKYVMIQAALYDDNETTISCAKLLCRLILKALWVLNFRTMKGL